MKDIDIVITWVDGNDPVWIQSKQEALKKQNPSLDVDVRDVRYRDFETLPYLFRGIEAFAPWVRKVHLVTSGQIPDWLNTECPSLQLDFHKDYIPEEYLPTFNSNSIELFFHKIPNLAEQFLYFNDDVFLLNPTSPEDFFVNGKPVDMLALQPDIANPKDEMMPYIYLNNFMLLSKHFNKRENMKKQPGAYFKLGYPLHYFIYNLVETAFPQFTGLYTIHGASPFLKNSFEELWELEPEAFHASCMNTFRSKEDLSQYAIREWQKLSGNFHPKNTQKYHTYLNLSNDTEALRQAILHNKKKIICINDTNDELDFDNVKKELLTAFQELLPEKSKFEK